MPSVNTYGMQRLISNLDPQELLQWEDEDGLGVPPANMRDAADDAEGVGDASMADDYGNMPSSGPVSAMDRYRAALEKRSVHEMTRPQISDHKPKGWQRALAAAANFGAGYVNAGRRTQVDPNAMRSINQSLLRPGYRGAMEKWQDQGHQADVELDSAGRELQMDSAQAKAQNEARRAAAYENAQRKSAELSEGRLKKLDQRQWKMSPNGRFIYDPETGEKKEMEPPKSPGAVKESPQEKTARLAKEAEEVMGYKPGTDEFRAYIGDKGALERIKSANRPAKGGKGAGKARIGTPNQFDGVELTADKEYAKAEQEARKKLENLGISGFDEKDPWKYSTTEEGQKVKTVEDWLTNRKNQIAQKYADRVKRYGGSAEPVKYKSKSAATTSSAPPNPYR